MNFNPQVSLVIVSRNRPAGLKRLISALRFQSYREFEVIVVSNYSDTSFLDDLPNANNICHIFFDQANISAARNHGIAISSGEVIAFCDDDAVPEPFWLERLTAPFENGNVGSAGGYVRGRNGIDYQWTAIKCDQFGDDFPLIMDSETQAQVFSYDGTYFAKVQGTNCAFRKDALLEIDGFDENYQFFLDETDVVFSLAKKNWATAIVPLAEVQHGFEESAERTNQRVPRTLKNIGSSKAYFIAKHANSDGAASIGKFCEIQRKRLLGYMVDGFLEPTTVDSLMKTLFTGLRMKLGSSRPANAFNPPPNDEIRLFLEGNRAGSPQFVALVGNTVSFRQLSRVACGMLKENTAITVFRFSYTALFHKRFFDNRGFWVQNGGLFGKSNRSSRVVRFYTLKSRAEVEIDNLYEQRSFGKLHVIRIFRKFGLFPPD